VIPDVHGCVNTLKALIEERIKPTRYDELYFLGDYIDRGPDSRGVIDFIRHLQEDEYTVTALKGNHEDFVVELYDALLSQIEQEPQKYSRFLTPIRQYLHLYLGLQIRL